MDCSSGLANECSLCRGRFAKCPGGGEKLVCYIAVFRVVKEGCVAD